MLNYDILTYGNSDLGTYFPKISDLLHFSLFFKKSFHHISVFKHSHIGGTQGNYVKKKKIMFSHNLSNFIKVFVQNEKLSFKKQKDRTLNGS